MRLVLRGVGWLLIAFGGIIGLYLFYSLYWTGMATSESQDRLFEQFRIHVADAGGDDDFALEVGELDPLTVDPVVDEPADEESGDDPVVAAAPVIPEGMEVGAPVAAMEFVRPGSADAPLDPVMVVEGVTVEALKAGPGRYPATAYPGQEGNVGIAGHRTTYGAPFWDLDKLRDGDEIHVTDLNGTRWIYEFVAQEIVLPEDVSVLDDDPLGTGKPMLTLTTCNPRWSQRERLIVFAELSDEQVPLVARAGP